MFFILSEANIRYSGYGLEFHLYNYIKTEAAKTYFTKDSKYFVHDSLHAYCLDMHVFQMQGHI